MNNSNNSSSEPANDKTSFAPASLIFSWVGLVLLVLSGVYAHRMSNEMREGIVYGRPNAVLRNVDPVRFNYLVDNTHSIATHCFDAGVICVGIGVAFWLRKRWATRA